MKIKNIGSNMTEIEVGDKTVLVSYQTPVAYHWAGVGYAKTEKFWSQTTSRHINKWLKMHGYSAERGDGLREIPQSELDAILK